MTFKLIKIGVAAVALLAIPFAAVAADIKPPVYKGVPRSVISYYNWTGLYVGGTVGYGTGTSEWDFAALSGGLVPTVDTQPKGMLYGVTLGYNWQAGSFVYGIEGDYNFSSINGSASCLVGTFTCETSNSFLATFRARVGYAFDRFLPYLTAGGAYGDIQATATPVVGVATSATESKFGMAIGAGLEYAFLGNWTGKIEYLYVDLGNARPFGAGTVEIGLQQHVFRAGLNYKFSGGY